MNSSSADPDGGTSCNRFAADAMRHIFVFVFPATKVKMMGKHKLADHEHRLESSTQTPFISIHHTCSSGAGILAGLVMGQIIKFLFPDIGLI